MNEHFYILTKTAAMRFKAPNISPSFKIDGMSSPGIKPASRVQPQMQAESPGADVGIRQPDQGPRGPMTFAGNPDTRMQQLGSVGKQISQSPGVRAGAQIGAAAAPAAYGVNELIEYLRSQQVSQ